MLTGLSEDQEISHALNVGIALLVSSCKAKAIPSIDVEEIYFLRYHISLQNLRISEFLNYFPEAIRKYLIATYF